MTPCMIQSLNLVACKCILTISRSIAGNYKSLIRNRGSDEVWNKTRIWVRSRRCVCLVNWVCYYLIAKPGNKTAVPSWPDPYTKAWSVPMNIRREWWFDMLVQNWTAQHEAYVRTRYYDDCATKWGYCVSTQLKTNSCQIHQNCGLLSALNRKCEPVALLIKRSIDEKEFRFQVECEPLKISKRVAILKYIKLCPTIDCSIYIANALDILQSCTELSICGYDFRQNSVLKKITGMHIVQYVSSFIATLDSCGVILRFSTLISSLESVGSSSSYSNIAHSSNDWLPDQSISRWPDKGEHYPSGTWRFSVQLILDGVPSKKHRPFWITWVAMWPYTTTNAGWSAVPTIYRTALHSAHNTIQNVFWWFRQPVWPRTVKIHVGYHLLKWWR